MGNVDKKADVLTRGMRCPCSFACTHRSDYNRVYTKTKQKLRNAQAVFKDMGNKLLALCSKGGSCTKPSRAADQMAKRLSYLF